MFFEMQDIKIISSPPRPKGRQIFENCIIALIHPFKKDVTVTVRSFYKAILIDFCMLKSISAFKLVHHVTIFRKFELKKVRKLRYAIKLKTELNATTSGIPK